MELSNPTSDKTSVFYSTENLSSVGFFNQTIDKTHVYYSTKDLNSAIAANYRINSIIVSILLSIGVIGNSIVILTYHFRMKNKRDDRYFIPCLAITNMLACVSASVLFVTLNAIPVMFTSSVMCKSLNFVTRVTCVESLTILLIISIQRYKKICTRGKSRMSLFWKRMAIVISMICSTVLSIPSLVFIGVNETKRNIYNNVTEFRCEHVTRNVHEKYGLNIYLGFIGLFFLGIVISTAVIYTLIGRRIYTKIQPPQTKSMLSASQDALNYNSLLKYSKSDTNLQGRLQSRSMEESEEMVLKRFTETNVQRSKSEAGKRKYTVSEVKKARAGLGLFVFRYYYMFVSISLVTSISFISPILILILEAAGIVTINELQPGFGFNIVLLLRRSYLFSYTINPFMFGLFDTTFRKALVEVFQQLPFSSRSF